MFIVTLLALPAAFAAISGTPHDFSGTAVYGTGGEICNACHTPHNAVSTLVPLWSHDTTASVFTMYSSSTMDATPAGTPSGASLACLSCHDGSVGIDAFVNSTGAGTEYMTGTARVGTDLSNDHPISFAYDTTLATTDGELYDPTTTPSVDALLEAGQVQCSSCHDVHDNANGNFLVMANAGSALCLTCHIK